MTNGATSLGSAAVWGQGGRWGVVGAGEMMGVGGWASAANGAGIDGRGFGAATAVVGIHEKGPAKGLGSPTFGPISVGDATEGDTRGFLGTDKHGVQGESDVVDGRGVIGTADKVGGIGVFGQSELNVGVQGQGADGVRGMTVSDTGAGVLGAYKQGGKDSTKDPRDGQTRGMLGTNVNGVQGESKIEGGKGVAGKASVGANAAAIYGESTDGFAGFFRGKVTITERLLIGRIDAKEVYAAIGLIGGLGKMFKIDHPLDPENKFLVHSSIEGQERRNMYEGVVTLDSTGSAWVTLPDWFEVLNTDFRYQLTCIGGFAGVYIATEIRGNRFQIAGGTAGLKVCWQVTGTRQDALAKAHPFQVEQEKTPEERGKYLNPVEHGLSEARGIHYTDADAVASLGDTSTAARA